MKERVTRTMKDDRKEQTLILTGNEAAAWAAMCSRVQVVTAYPITPQTTVMETIADFVDGGEMDAKFVKVESEHSVMAGMVGASMTGARTFTATSGQGLLYMAEMVHWVAGTRLPVVTTISSRGIAPPWNIWVDFSDVMNMRDTGWMIQFASTHQEIFDSIPHELPNRREFRGDDAHFYCFRWLHAIPHFKTCMHLRSTQDRCFYSTDTPRGMAAYLSRSR